MCGCNSHSAPVPRGPRGEKMANAWVATYRDGREEPFLTAIEAAAAVAVTGGTYTQKAVPVAILRGRA